MSDKIEIIGCMDHTLDHTFVSANKVYGTDGVCPTITTCCGGGHQPKIMEVKRLGFIDKGTGPHESNLVYNSNGLAPTVTASYGYKQPPAMHVEVETVQIKQATKSGKIECEVGGVTDLTYPTSETRRERAIQNGQICPTLTTENIPSRIEPWIWNIDGQDYRIRIRKLMPKECGRLMGVSDEDIDKMAKVNSQTQLYKEYGNSICLHPLMDMFKQLFPDNYTEIIQGDKKDMEKKELVNKDKIKQLTMNEVLQFIKGRLQSADRESEDYKKALVIFNVFKDLMFEIDADMEAKKDDSTEFDFS